MKVFRRTSHVFKAFPLAATLTLPLCAFAAPADLAIQSLSGPLQSFSLEQRYCLLEQVMDVDTTTVDITQGGDPQRFLFGGDAETRNFVGAALTSGIGVASGAFDPQTVAVQTRAPGSGSFIETVISLERGRLQLSFSQFSSGAPIVGVALIDTKTGGVTSQAGPVRALGVQTDAQTQERARELSEIAVRNCLIQMAL